MNAKSKELLEEIAALLQQAAGLAAGLPDEAAKQLDEAFEFDAGFVEELNKIADDVIGLSEAE